MKPLLQQKIGNNGFEAWQTPHLRPPPAWRLPPPPESPLWTGWICGRQIFVSEWPPQNKESEECSAVLRPPECDTGWCTNMERGSTTHARRRPDTWERHEHAYFKQKENTPTHRRKPSQTNEDKETHTQGGRGGDWGRRFFVRPLGTHRPCAESRFHMRGVFVIAGASSLAFESGTSVSKNLDFFISFA